MLLSGVLFVVFLAGCWLYCLTDAAFTPAGEYTGWSKRAWIVIIAVTFIAGAIAWLTARKLARARRWPSATVDHLALARLGDANVRWYEYRPMTSDADATPGRHPAGRSRTAGRLAPKGPDDDPEFLRELARRIHGDPTS